MKKTIVILLLLLTLVSCGVDSNKVKRIEVYGDVISNAMQLESFRSIVVAGPVDLLLVQDGGSRASIETYESIMEQFCIRVVDEVLYLYLKDSTAMSNIHFNDVADSNFTNALISGSRLKWPGGKKILNIRLSFSELEEIQVIGESDIRSEGSWKGESLSLDVAGALHLAADLQVEEFDIEIAGAANLELRGSAGKFNIECAGAGSVRAYDFLANAVNMDIAGVCTANIYAAQSLNINIAGLGNVRYKGNPPEVNIEKAGMGKIRQIEENEEELTL
ncbi:MAG: DUF2807 domain-containing protein [Candidatus Marinimicrobia bacterium]|nr:DUF2807 domain-containing protein [Candidatus Neomarinimicrobiota bacterium]MDD5710066.1 DUF2807 domain-containing protein [Candidatus Neomarinimicrobiota bacterium]